MTHIELSLSRLANAPGLQTPLGDGLSDSLERWIAPVVVAEESCLVIDADGIIVAASMAYARMLSFLHSAELIGRHVLDPDVLLLIDFTAAGNAVGESERDQIAPLLALSSGRLARSLLRVRTIQGSKTLDAIATPLREDNHVIGSLSFFTYV